MQQPDTAVLLLNVGSPDRPTTKAVRPYLSQFLNDPRVIDLPWLWRKLLVNLIIVPFRAPKSAKLYRRLWTKDGSPLIFHSENAGKKLQERLGENYRVFVAMRYGNPSIAKAVSEIKSNGFKQIIAVPMYPQFAMSTTETSIEEVKFQMKKQRCSAELKTVEEFYSHLKFIDAFAAQISKYGPEKYDHIVFSYHGLPNRHVERIHPQVKADSCNCSEQFPEHGKHCYKAQCYETSRLLAARLNLRKDQYSVAFQSRLSNNWLQPFTDETLESLQKSGVKKVLLAAPSFVADCLETIVELGIEYREFFEKEPANQLQMVESLNSNDDWVELLDELVQNVSRKGAKTRSR
ncbi:MAG: ferrochelatase [Bacteroidetes bacterium GWF2_42_66]|nr:MAG: ferrochelatase [Bacteroidetes bacterium GWA2_42_15]OFX97925.1 MAG: ferrochelatase [Bacteroidetes bacterium GWE2_42_39]OFY45837.1 MAG: ferrochelatase [Bacteroidetes bacterium GWF2_42_66]HBL74661.1 ferrochelatase [Prolixibacteraceae bacterium]HCR89346.1 ferrochelatase [Prolixibacteraceae bacterium]